MCEEGPWSCRRSALPEYVVVDPARLPAAPLGQPQVPFTVVHEDNSGLFGSCFTDRQPRCMQRAQEYVMVEPPQAGMLQPWHQAGPAAARAPVLLLAAGLPTPCRGGLASRPPPPPGPGRSTRPMAPGAALPEAHVNMAMWQPPEAQKGQFVERFCLRNWVTVLALLLVLAVAVVGLVLILDKGQHSFQALVPPRPHAVNINGLVRLPGKAHPKEQSSRRSETEEAQRDSKLARGASGVHDAAAALVREYEAPGAPRLSAAPGSGRRPPQAEAPAAAAGGQAGQAPSRRSRAPPPQP